MNLLEIREAVAAQLRSYIESYALVRSSKNPDSPVSYPCVTVLLQPGDSIEYDQTFGGDPDVLLDIEVKTRGDIVAAQEKLSAFLSTGTPQSIVDAINADTKLGGVVMDCKASSASVADPPDGVDGDHVATVHLRVFAGDPE